MRQNNPLVSIIIPTKNSEIFLQACLDSLQKQTYKNTEIIVVDNKSTDNTLTIATKYTKNVFNKQPERSAQRNYGAKKAKGKYIFFADSDMESSPNVIKECISTIENNKDMKALVIPEESFGKGFWAECKHLERSFYIGISFMEAARFFDKEAFLKVKGYDENLVSGEDWYLSQKLEKIGKIGRINAKIFHNEGRLTYISSVSKKYYYAKHFAKYINLKDNLHLKNQISIGRRYLLFFAHPKKLFSNPMVGLGMLFLKTSEFAAGGIGYLLSK